MAKQPTQDEIMQKKTILSAIMRMLALLSQWRKVLAKQPTQAEIMQNKSIFISHHHEDAGALVLVKEKLRKFGFECFLAHQDIEHGEEYIPKIEKALKKCDAFLYVGNEKSNNSAFCQQELGMAKGLGKPMITTIKGCETQGFIKYIQALSYREIDEEFAKIILGELWKELKSDDLNEALNFLGCRGFSKRKVEGFIHLEPNNWDDYGFKTTFSLRYKDEDQGTVKIGFLDQDESKPTTNILPDTFPCLSLPFFSRVIYWNTSLTQDQQDCICLLLNDVDFLDIESSGISSQDVYRKSLIR